MANYRVHDLVTWVSAIGVAPFCYWIARDYPPVLAGYPLTTTPGTTTALLVGAYLFSGLWLSNDLDIYSRIYRRWGPLRFLWYPYQQLVSHRSWLSHGLVVGPLLRMVYLYVMIELTLICAHGVATAAGWSTAIVESGMRLTSEVWPYVVAHPQICAPLIVGLILGGVAHSLVDLV